MKYKGYMTWGCWMYWKYIVLNEGVYDNWDLIDDIIDDEGVL